MRNMVTQHERELFEKLSKDREENARVIEKRSMRGVKGSVVEKYSDQAHFIYELLQNADDCGANQVRFILEPSRLIFVHNGTRHFSITDVSNEEKVDADEPIGDINSITSVGQSTKEDSQNQIGKFGVGFKSVFQYTDTPHIYDKDYKFRIERFVVPHLLDEDFPGRNPEETLFVFPFDKLDKTSKSSYNDIFFKLLNLSYPLLFLSHLKEIKYEIGENKGYYSKEICEDRQFDDVTAELICCAASYNQELIKDRLWLFSNTDEKGNKYSVGFFLEVKDGKTYLKPVDMPAFCFFPTKEPTGLHYIIQAPFLLTDSRESIKENTAHNTRMLDLLGDLASKSIVFLKKIGEDKGNRLVDDHILSIIPYKEPYSWSMWAPFYEDTKKIFETESVLPSRKGYTSKPHAYWAVSSKMTDLFSNEQLEQLCGDPQAKWAFPSIGRDTHGSLTQDGRDIRGFIDDVTHQYLSESDMLDKITAPFIESQSIEWLVDFYKWVDEDKDRRKKAARLPIFPDQHGHAMSAFDEKGMEVLFLPSDVTTDDEYHYLAQSLCDKEELKNFFSSIKIAAPSPGDYIYNKIIPLYKDTDANSNISIETADKNFKLFFDYYCSHREEKFIDLKECSFLTYCDPDGQWHRAKANELYLPTPELKEWFANSPSAHFVPEKKYVQIIGEQPNKDLLEDFLKDLGVKVDPQVTYCVRDPDTLEDANWKYSLRYNIWLEPQIDGLNEFIKGMPFDDIAESIDYYSNEETDEAKILQKNRSKAKLLWEEMKKLLKEATYYSSFSGDLKIWENNVFYGYGYRFPSGEHHWFYRRDQVEFYASEVETQLRKLAWNYTKNEEFDPESVDDYDPSPELLKVFGIKTLAKSPQEEAKELIEKGGLTPEEVRKFITLVKDEVQRKHQEETAKENSEIANDDSPCDSLLSSESIENIAAPKGNESSSPSSHITTPLPSTVSASSSPYSDENDEQEEDNSLDSDSIDKNIKKKQSEIESLSQLREKVTNASKLPKYSFGWFKALLSLEKDGLSSRKPEVSISFSKVEKDPDPDSPRIIVLSRPSRYIPQSIEDIPNIPLDLHMENGKTRSPEIEVVSVKGNTLRVKAKTEDQIKGIDFSKVQYATIDVKNPDFLLDTLTEQFANLDLPDDFNMQQNLCENIEFLVGPPGTGKTTYLAKEILQPLMEKEDSYKVLVLTPTNKAADVLVKKIMQVSGNDDSYNDWLARIGITEDAEIEKSPVFREKNLDMDAMQKCVAVTTIARFPYDFLIPGKGKTTPLNEIKWDYIVVDEASMIPLADIVFLLYKQRPEQFIIAGDPFQIEPIVKRNEWKDQNIYSLVKLNSFENPSTVPHAYKVVPLSRQYRSIPEIGEVFSNFAYNGMLEHDRNFEKRKDLHLESLGISPLNIIKYPVKKYESIYQVKKLQESPYQIYSALLTVEYIRFLADKISQFNPGTPVSIGVISPYRAQADIMDKLISREKIPEEIKVQAGTIHKFQGDECDIIFVVFNPPKNPSSSKTFLNKMNILNVAVSRARDYLFVIMPEDETDGIEDLVRIRKIESLMRKNGKCSQFLACDLEKLLFGQSDYLENNVFSTGHQDVNVYDLPEKQYEVRAEDDAVDIQIHQNDR